MLDKLITADQLKMLSDEEKYAKRSRYIYNAGGGYSQKKYYKVLTATFKESDTWHNQQYVFAYSSRHGGTGFIIVHVEFFGSFDQSINDCFKFRLIRAKTTDTSRVKLFFNSNTRKLTFVFESVDYSNLRLNWLNNQGTDDRLTYEAIQPLDNLPSDIGDEIPMHEALFDDSLTFASESDVSNLFGGG